MILHLRVESISVLAWYVLSCQNWMIFPSLTISVSTSLLPSTGFGIHLSCLNILICFPVCRVSIFFRTNVCSFSSANPLSWLNNFRFTIHAGFDLCIYVFPYLWLEAFLDLSTNASLVILKPVVANPDLFMLTSGLVKTYLVLLAYVLACKLSALSLGMKPWYPGIWLTFGEVDSCVIRVIRGYDDARKKIGTYHFWSIRRNF